MKKLNLEKRKKKGIVICDQCGYKIKNPVYSARSPTRLQMRCTPESGRPGQKKQDKVSGCQAKAQLKMQRHGRQDKKASNDNPGESSYEAYMKKARLVLANNNGNS